ncbi:MAG: UvrB/UvrC motif-containing protein [Saccharofermentanales bacterium]|jgi:protein arginine kinase activator
MLCESCRQREATLKVTRRVNGQQTETYLCDVCAGQARRPTSSVEHLFDSMLESMLGGPSLFSYASGGAPRPTARPRVCPVCGETERELRDTGLLGCATCYDTFADVLKPVFQRAQGHTRHVAPTPEPASPVDAIASMRERLKAAVEREDYESAAELRDAIHAAEADEGGDDA